MPAGALKVQIDVSMHLQQLKSVSQKSIQIYSVTCDPATVLRIIIKCQ